MGGQDNEGDEADTLSLAGEAELALGDAEAAEGYFSRAAKLTPENTQVKTSLAMAHMTRGDTSMAFAELNAAAASSRSITAELALYSARLKRREYAAALAAVDLVAKKQPRNPELLGMRGRVYLLQQNYAQARNAFEEQAKAEPSLFSAVSSLAAMDVLERKPDDARKRLEARIEVDPKNVYALLMLARLRAETGAPVDEVKQLLASAVQAAPQSPSPRLELIALTLRKRLYKEALVAAQEAAAAMPNDAAVMDAVGRAQMEAGDVEQAISTFRKLAGADGKSGVAYTRLADIYKTTGKRDQAEVALRKALEIEPGMVQAQLALIDLLIASNRKADALELIKRIQRDTPNLPAGYAFEAAYHLKLNAVDSAVVAYRTGLAKTGDAALALQLHRLYARAARRDDADRFASSWLKDHPKDVDFEYQVAETDIGRNDLAKAETRLQRLQTDNPDNVLALNNLAYVLMMRGKPGALAYAQKAAELAPENGHVLDTLATALVAEKQFDKALVAQKRAAERTPQDESMRLRLAQIAISASDKTLARNELTRLQGLGASFKQQDEVTRLLKTL
jgi:putative PEP-CTERM system TPR-repeat lipoprotein